MRKKLFAAIAVLLLLVGSVVVTSYVVLSQGAQKPFYVGVTYGGSSVQEAKALVDRVKGYTNLFVLQSGSMQGYTDAMEEIGDYVVASNLSYAVSSTVSESLRFNKQQLSSWLIEAKERWGERFIGIYYNDEPGGKMLDSGAITLKKETSRINETMVRVTSITTSGESITVKTEYIFQEETVTIQGNSGFTISSIFSFTTTTYANNGDIFIETSDTDSRGYYREYINYYSNGTITIDECLAVENNFYAPGNITKYAGSILSYEELLKQKPIQNYGTVANAFVDTQKDLLKGINKTRLNEADILVFTADYGLYWWDYKGGYDVVLAELAWNHSDVQHIGLVRGAANLQGKSWGTILTWKYTHPPYLAGGVEMFEQMKTSYEAGAEYVIIFNYSEDPVNPNTLQKEHFEALEHFWNDVVQNPEIIHSGIKADAVLVLPQNYGWGMRNPQDNIWGIWPADSTSQQIWNQLENKIDQYGLKLDIVFEDPSHSATWKYSKIYYWNQK
ncbi:MAG: hypothetical protein FWG55_06455 [Candidatus Bathyarchaeota archaeon]|nr:hypothetical protein [Candidatus Termiticorpusculum sp.]